MEFTKIAVVGAGSIGAVVAWHLARAGLKPSVVARKPSAALLRREGLTLSDAGNNEKVSVHVTDAPESLGQQDLVFVGFKAQDWPAGLSSVLPLVGPKTIVVPLVNGIPWWFFQGFGGPHEGRIVKAVDPDGLLIKSIPPHQILGGVVYIAAERMDAAHIAWSGRKKLVLGEPYGGPSARLEAVVAVLNHAGLECEASERIRDIVWHKLLGNVSMNPLSVVTGATMGRMLTHPPLRRILVVMIEEALMLATALGVKDSFDIEERLKLPPLMMNYKSSMLQDFEAGRPLELGALSQAVAELAELVGLKTSMIDTIGTLASFRALERVL
jgi:2-dehydropantoate 2-reductase